MFLIDIWNSFLYIPILNLLVALYHILFNNMGLAIIVMTILLKLVTHPFTKPSLEMAKKQKELQPEMDKLKKKYKNKQVFAQKQMALYKKHGINPAAGCLPQIIQIVVVFALYRVFTNLLIGNGVEISKFNDLLYNFDFLKFSANETLNTSFLYLSLGKPDQLYILPVLAAGFQFLMSRYTMKTTKKMEKVAKDTPDKSDDIMYNMQEQMGYMMPIMTLVIGLRLPSGLVLYWLVSTILALVQYRFIYQNDR